MATSVDRIKKELLRFDEVESITGYSRRHIYDLLNEGYILAHSKDSTPGRKGTRIVAKSLWAFIDKGVIDPSKWEKA